jgi:hypothetical protein
LGVASTPEPKPEPEAVETPAERQAREREESLGALAAIPMAEWSVEQSFQWVGLLELPMSMADSVQAFVVDDEIDGEELENFIAKTLQKSLKRAKFADFSEVSQLLLEQRDLMLASQQHAAGAPLPAPALRVEFDRKLDLLGSGRFGNVFRCTLDGEPGFAVKRVDALKASLVSKEIEVLTLVRKTDEGGHPNVVKYFSKEEDTDFVYICMELCDTETLDSRIKKMVGEGLRMDAVRQLFGGIDYLHELNIIHRDLKPANILFRGAVLKICDMGQVCQQSLNTLLHLVFCGRLCI